MFDKHGLTFTVDLRGDYLMKQYLITAVLRNKQISIPTHADNLEGVRAKWKNINIVNIKLDEHPLYFSIINKIKSESSLVYVTKTIKIRGETNTKEYYKRRIPDGTLLFKLLKDDSDGMYYNYVEYSLQQTDNFNWVCSWTISNAECFYDMFFSGDLVCEIPLKRAYGQPKLDKPKEIIGVKQNFYVDWIPRKCSCPCFINGDDLWIKHRDFFSTIFIPPDPKDRGKPLSYLCKKYFNIHKHEKFIYADCYGEIKLRNEAWMVFRNMRQAVLRGKYTSLKALQSSFVSNTWIQNNFENLTIYSLNITWIIFFEQVHKTYCDYLHLN